MRNILLIVIIISLLGCQISATKFLHSKKRKKPKVTYRPQQNITEYTPDISRKYQYRVRGKQYHVFKSGNNFQQTGVASWYGPGFHGKKTANGERYDMYTMTAAHKTLPLGTRVKITNLSNRKSIIVRINDRGPFHGGRIIDLSKRAAQQLGILEDGSARVHIKTID